MLRLLPSALLVACIQPLDCEQQSTFAVAQSVSDVDLDDAAANSGIAREDLTCVDVCIEIRRAQGEIDVDAIDTCTWDVDPASRDTGVLGIIDCRGTETEQTCLG